MQFLSATIFPSVARESAAIATPSLKMQPQIVVPVFMPAGILAFWTLVSKNLFLAAKSKSKPPVETRPQKALPASASGAHERRRRMDIRTTWSNVEAVVATRTVTPRVLDSWLRRRASSCGKFELKSVCVCALCRQVGWVCKRGGAAKRECAFFRFFPTLPAPRAPSLRRPPPPTACVRA